jgi:hypothetical protein
MQIKCTSCGAPQNTENETNCQFCGILLNKDVKITENELSQFNLAFYEYNKGNFSKSILLFEEIIKTQPSNASAWIFKINSELRLEMPIIDNYENFEHSVKFLLDKFGDTTINNFLENSILETIEYLFKLKVRRPIPKINHNNVEGFLESCCLTGDGKNKEFNFFRVINRLSEFFSAKFSIEFLRLLKDYIHNLENNNFYNKKTHSKLLNTPDLFFDLTALVQKSQINLTEYFISLLKSLENSTDDDEFLRSIVLDTWIEFPDALPKWYFSENEIETIGLLDVNYTIIRQYLKGLLETELSQKNVQALSNNKNLKKEPKSGCFIATAAMGDYNHPVVIDLRSFRDNWLIKRKWGIKFTNWYYSNGPKAARVIEKSTLLKKLVYICMVKPLQIITKKLR